MADVDLAKYLGIVWKWLWVIALSTLLAGVVSSNVTDRLPPIYRASATLMVGEAVTNPTLSPDDVALAERVADSYAELIQRQPILDATSRALGLSEGWLELKKNVLTVRVPNTQLIELRVLDTNPDRAKAITEEIIRQLSDQSAATDSLRQLEEHRKFTRDQLDLLQANIKSGEASLAASQAKLATETSARAVLDRQDEIKALELKLTDWRTNYATLLASYQGKRSVNSILVIEPASVPSTPVGPNKLANVLLAALAGALIATVAVFAVEYLSDTLASAEDVSRALGLPTLGSIGRLKKVGGVVQSLVTLSDPDSPNAEAYRVVRTNIQLAGTGGGRGVLLVTSPSVGEGKSVTSANLAVSYAQAGNRTILVDADLRHPSVYALFGVQSARGLTSVLMYETPTLSDGEDEEPRRQSDLCAHIEASLVPTAVPQLRILTAGPRLGGNPAELFSSATTDNVLTHLRELADVVVLDCPPVLPVADTRILAAKGVSALVVAQAGRTRGQSLRLATEALLRARATVVGVVLNQTSRDALPEYGYHWRGQRETATK
jgi:polysaccharide biosynthesis transport protein